VETASIGNYLDQHPFFKELNADVRAFLVAHVQSMTLEKGRVLFFQGEQADKFFILLNGSVAIQVPAIMGPNLEIQVLGPDQVLGWSWLISPYIWSFQAVAIEDAELLLFDGAAILARCEQDSAFGYALLKKFAELMSKRLDAARKKMMDEWNPEGFA
jgi:CRP/FNR family transcriptional regulator, cyclic AMP receptor protein